MINAIIFDFGDIFINLDKETPIMEFKKLGLSNWNSELQALNLDFETGKITEADFLEGIQKHIPHASIKEIKSAWNTVLMDFPLIRLEFLQKIASKYRLFLLSNTDSIHIEKFQDMVGISFYSDFYQCFEKVYFSFEMGARKPDEETFNLIVQKHNLIPKQTLFVDDSKEHTDVAASLGFQTWNLQPGKEDIINLFDNKTLFPL
ncbi:MAG: HAD family phosphatase [Bacteroidota bacterium]